MRIHWRRKCHRGLAPRACMHERRLSTASRLAGWGEATFVVGEAQQVEPFENLPDSGLGLDLGLGQDDDVVGERMRRSRAACRTSTSCQWK